MIISQRKLQLEPEPKSAFHGIHGWLLFLCIYLTIISPLFTLAQIHTLADHAVYLVLGLILLSIVSGILLWNRKFVGVIVAKTFFSLNLVLIGFGLLEAVIQRDGIVFVRLVFQTCAPLAWLLYLWNSRRIKETYKNEN
jgi:hypothetical protein